jgi:tRNA-binding EMAP/Myf-like protein
VQAWKHPDSDKLWCEEIDLGEPEPRQIASGLRHFYAEEADLTGKQAASSNAPQPPELKGQRVSVWAVGRSLTRSAVVVVV